MFLFSHVLYKLFVLFLLSLDVTLGIQFFFFPLFMGLALHFHRHTGKQKPANISKPSWLAEKDTWNEAPKKKKKMAKAGDDEFNKHMSTYDKSTIKSDVVFDLIFISF